MITYDKDLYMGYAGLCARMGLLPLPYGVADIDKIYYGMCIKYQEYCKLIRLRIAANMTHAIINPVFEKVV